MGVFHHMSLVNAVRCACVQVHPTDSQYREYKASGDSFWSKLDSVKVDTAKLEHLFESKSKEIPVTKVNQLSVPFMYKGGHTVQAAQTPSP